MKNIGKTQLTNSNEYTVELGEKLFSNLKLNSTADAFMRPATKRTLKAESIGTYADTPDLTYTAGTKIGTIYSDLGLSDGISKKNVTEYVDGDYAGAFAYDIVKGSKDKVGGNGVLLNVYYNDDAETITFVEVNTYIGKVTAAYPDTTTKDAYVKGKDMDGYACPGAGKEFEGTEPAEPDVISAGSDGTSDVFNTMGETYRINRGVEKWSGLRVYEHPGYVKLGVTANGGWIMTPELESLSAAPETVSVSLDFLRFDNETGTSIVSAEGAGVVPNGEVNNTVLPAQTSAAGRKWKTLTFTVQDATNKTRIKIEAQTYNEKGYRINIDNIVVMAADKTEVTEKLPAPELEKITYTPAMTSVAFAWEGVKGATSYDASVAQQTRPDFRKTVETEDSNCEFADLEPGLYIFTVRAL